MAAEVETMFSARGVPWHGLGEVVTESQTAKEALVLAGLDWEVELTPVYAKAVVPSGPTHVAHNQEILVPDTYAVLRDSDQSVLGVVGSKYKPVQNRDLFGFLDDLVSSGEAKYETAGSLAQGRRVFMTAKFPQEIRIGGEIPVDLYLVVASSHDGSMALTAAVTPVCVVCQNTLNMSMRSAKQKWSIRHTQSVDGRIAEARNALNLTFEYTAEFEKEMEKLVQDDFSKAEFERMVKEVFPNPKKASAGFFSDEQFAMIGCLESSPNITDGARYTRWGALMAVTEYLDWGRDFRASKVKTPVEQRTEATWFGKTVEAKNRTLAYLSQ